MLVSILVVSSVLDRADRDADSGPGGFALTVRVDCDAGFDPCDF